ncbi:MAG: glutamate--tRNA ligase family protein [Tenericutes bacterium]|nr:glutamate--tRNA ligase family protein [Mycoplasmatota bacterium]
MTDNEKLAELLYPDVRLTIDVLEKKYPKRNLDEKAEVCRFAPSPTGRMHMGNLFASFVPERFAHQSNGVFILRIEDTDDKRAIDDGINLIMQDLKEYNYKVDEGPNSGGEYGPYIQSQRKEIYHTVAKYLVSIGRAYPCFCSEDDLTHMREHQEHKKERIGYYGRYAKCRNLTYDEVKAHIDNGDKWVLRLKSMGDFNKKIVFKDLIKGTIELPENDIDQVLVKSDGIPPYAFAHVCDDHFMRVTIVTRDDSYISSVPYHLELWDACGFEKPKFAHLLPLNKKDGEVVRKLSKRKDPEAAVAFYHEKGIPTEAVKLYFATLLNSNFDGWFLQNQDKDYQEFSFSFNKMCTSGGSLFDIEKLINISKNYLSRLKAEEVFANLDNWSKEFDNEFNQLIKQYREYTISVLNIEREQKKPRKDFACYSEIKENIWYMYDELFSDIDFDFSFLKHEEDAKKIVSTYLSDFFDINDDKETWFNKIKELTLKMGYNTNMKEYKENPDEFRGSIADISNVIRVSLTTKLTTPDLFEIIKLLGNERVCERFKRICG